MAKLLLSMESWLGQKVVPARFQRMSKRPRSAPWLTSATFGASFLISLAAGVTTPVCAADEPLPPLISAARELPLWDVYRSLDPQLVVDDCSKAIQRQKKLSDKDITDVFMIRATAHLHMGKWELAKRDYEEVLKRRPKDRDARLYRAEALIQLGSIREARKEAEQLIEAWPKHGPLYGMMAAVCFSEGKTNEAIQQAGKCISLDPTIAQPFAVRAQAYYRQKQFGQCLVDINHYIELEPNNYPGPADAPYLLRGRALCCLGRFKDAAVNFHMARRLNPRCYEATFELSYVYVHLQKFHVALHLAEEFVNQEEQKPYGHALLATCLNYVKKFPEAIKAAETALKLDPRNGMAHREWGRAACFMANYDVAMHHYNRSLDLDPGNIPAMMNTARLLATCPVDRVRDGKRAKELALKVFNKSNWRKDEALVLLAEAQAECGEFDNAKKSLGEALKLVGKGDGDAEWKGSIIKRMKLFEQRKPFRRGEQKKGFAPGPTH